MTPAIEKQIWDFFKGKNFTDEGIAGLMGNLYAESGLDSQNLQNTFEKKFGLSDRDYTRQVDTGAYKDFANDKAGYGLAQWTYWTRKRDLLAYARSQGASIGNLDMQLNYLYQELENTFPLVLEVLKEADTVQEASDMVLTKFEKPAKITEETKQKRCSYGQKYYDQYKSKQAKEGKQMKYSDSNPPLVCMQTNSTCYKGTTRMAVKGILWHSTGANNPNLCRYVQPSDNDPKRAELLKILGTNKNKNDWNHIKREAGLNFWIGKLANGTVAAVQTMPWDYRPWGCGSGSKGSCNNGWIQFEICEDNLKDANYFAKVYKEACEMTAYLCKKFGINPKGTVKMNGVTVPTILCHQDSYKLKLGSNHGDVYNWFNNFNKTMDNVRQDVYDLINAKPAVKPTPTPAPAPKKEEEDDDMALTQEMFNQFMDKWLEEQSKREDVGTWSAEARKWAEEKKYIQGDTNNRKMYKKPLTREEFVTVLHRIYEDQ